MQPFVIRQGDYLMKLAYSFGFDADAVWNDDKNTDLRKVRPDHNILYPGDVLYVPEKSGNAVATALVTGATNDFATSAPVVMIAVRFTGQGLGSQPCSVRELDSLTGLTTDADGLLSFSAPVTLETITISLDALSIDCACLVGGLDPIATASGVYQRLQNLGYIPADLPFDALDPGPLRAGLRGLKWSLYGADAFVAPTRADPIPSVTDYEPSADDSPQPDTGTSDPSPAPGGQDGAVSPGATDPSGPCWSAEGLTAEGVLDDATYTQLLDAHGC
jgi:hypothetical protein